MSVRGSKNKIIIYVIGACIIAFAILLYHNASQKLDAVEISYERCHLNEESLSAQLQVNLEYKIRLEKSLQQEKSDHAQTKEEFQKKLEDERQTRERESLEAINKFNSLKEQYNFIQHKHDIIQENYDKLKQLKISEGNDKRHLEEVVQNLKKELSLLKDIKMKLSHLESENLALQEENKKLKEKVELYEKTKTSSSDMKVIDKIMPLPLFHKNNGKDGQVYLPVLTGPAVSPSSRVIKSSTTQNKIEREYFPPSNSHLINVSTPMINPQAVQNDDKIPIAPMPQPRQESTSNKDLNILKQNENVAPKPDGIEKESPNAEVPVQGVLRASGILNHFDHVPEIRSYKKLLKESERNNHGGEVIDDDEAMAKNMEQNNIHRWREGEFREQSLNANPLGNEIPRNQGYQYPVEDEGRKEIDDDDDLDPMDYQNVNGKKYEEKENEPKQVIQIPFGGKHDSVMLQPK